MTSRDPSAPLEEGCLGECRLEFVRNLLELQRDLSQLPGQPQRLSLEPLTRERGGAWLALHNGCFFEMPNSATYGPWDLDRALEEGHRCGFAVVNGVRVGVYELDLTQEVPEIEGIALQKDVRGQGLGRELLWGTMALLAEEGFDRCKLLVASDNESAFSLYRRTGFKAADAAQLNGKSGRRAMHGGRFLCCQRLAEITWSHCSAVSGWESRREQVWLPSVHRAST